MANPQVQCCWWWWCRSHVPLTSSDFGVCLVPADLGQGRTLTKAMHKDDHKTLRILPIAYLPLDDPSARFWGDVV